MTFVYTPDQKLAFPATAEAAPVVQMAGGRVSNIMGQYISVLPSTPEATLAMWAGGVYVPGPIQDPRRFKWPSVQPDFTPMQHQIQTADFIVNYRRSFVLNRPGTGKTASAIWASEFMMAQGMIDMTIILCPKSCMEDVWVPEISNLAPLKNVSVAHGRKIALALSGSRDYIILNHDGVSNKSILPTLQKLQQTKRLFVIIDEATAFKNYEAARTANLESFVNDLNKTRVCMMTGTPHPKGPTDVYGMCRVLNPSSVPNSMYLWKRKVMWEMGRFKWEPRDDAGVHLKAALHPAICFDSKDCIELPPLHEYGYGDNPVPNSDFKTRGLALTADQQTLIDTIKRDAYAEIAGGQSLTIAHAAVLRNKIFQISQGVVITDDQQHHAVDCTPRLRDLLLCLSRRKKKFIVFCDYKAVQARVQQLLQQHGFTTSIVNGDVSPTQRAKIFKSYRAASGGIDGIIAHPKTMSHGLTLTDGDTTYWWGPPSSPELFDQGNHRQFRKGQKDAVHIWASAASPDEADYFQVLVDRGNLEKATLAMFKP